MSEYAKLIEDIETLSTYAADEYTRLVLMRAADAIEELQAINQRQLLEIAVLGKPRWIPVTERLPKEEACGCRVLCVLRKKSRGWVWVDDRLFMDGDFWHPKHQKGKVTHWMPLPEPPKEETE